MDTHISDLVVITINRLIDLLQSVNLQWLKFGNTYVISPYIL